MNNWFAAAAAGALTFFGMGGDRMATQTPNFNQGSSTHKEQRDARPASTTKPTLNITCVSTAVAAREVSIDAAYASFSSAVNSAYTGRSSALASAYTLSDATSVRTAVKTAWKQFSTVAQGAKRAWQKSRENAWQTFRTAVKACGPGANALTDGENAGSEMSGQ